MYKSDFHYKKIEELAREIRDRAEISAVVKHMGSHRRQDFETGIRYALQCIVDDEIENFSATGFEVEQ